MPRAITRIFSTRLLGERMRVEHWDNALNMGAYAGRNMAGRAASV